jgi:GNAT superfamily N-acetyltransferase
MAMDDRCCAMDDIHDVLVRNKRNGCFDLSIWPKTRMIREVQPSELNLVTDLGSKFWAEGALPGSLKPAVFITNWTKLMSIGMGKIFGLFNDGKFVGCLGCLVVNDLNDGEMVASETFWFVDPEFRGQGVKLLIHFMRWAKEIGCSRISMVHLINEHAEKLNDIYVKMGFTQTEVHYIKELY